MKYIFTLTSCDRMRIGNTALPSIMKMFFFTNTILLMSPKYCNLLFADWAWVDFKIYEDSCFVKMLQCNIWCSELNSFQDSQNYLYKQEHLRSNFTNNYLYCVRDRGEWVKQHSVPQMRKESGKERYVELKCIKAWCGNAALMFYLFDCSRIDYPLDFKKLNSQCL